MIVYVLGQNYIYSEENCELISLMPYCKISYKVFFDEQGKSKCGRAIPRMLKMQIRGSQYPGYLKCITTYEEFRKLIMHVTKPEPGCVGVNDTVMQADIIAFFTNHLYVISTATEIKPQWFFDFISYNMKHVNLIKHHVFACKSSCSEDLMYSEASLEGFPSWPGDLILLICSKYKTTQQMVEIYKNNIDCITDIVLKSNDQESGGFFKKIECNVNDPSENFNKKSQKSVIY